MENMNSTVADWMRDAHAMEQQAEKMLSSFTDRLESYPELKSQLLAHLDATRQNQDLLRNAIENAGESTSAFKDLGAKLLAMSQTASGAAVEDEAVKGTLSIYVFQHMKIASYTMLSVAARHIGDPNTMALCERILPKEIALSEWLERYLPEITIKYLARVANASDHAKR